MENTFVKIKDIVGEGREAAHKEWIPVKSIDWGVERTVDMTDLGTTQRGYANANFNKVGLTSDMSKASAKICQYVATGKITPEVTIEMCRSGDDASKGMEPYLIFTLKDCMIDSYSVSGGEDAIPNENWTLAYRAIEYQYKPADYKTGKLQKPEVFKYNLETGDVS